MLLFHFCCCCRFSFISSIFSLSKILLVLFLFRVAVVLFFTSSKHYCWTCVCRWFTCILLFNLTLPVLPSQEWCFIQLVVPWGVYWLLFDVFLHTRTYDEVKIFCYSHVLEQNLAPSPPFEYASNPPQLRCFIVSFLSAFYTIIYCRVSFSPTFIPNTCFYVYVFQRSWWSAPNYDGGDAEINKCFCIMPAATAFITTVQTDDFRSLR